MQSIQQRHSYPFLRHKAVIGGVFLTILLALTVSLGVGLTRGDDDSNEAAPAQASSTTNAWVPASVWKPVNGTSWQYELLNRINKTSTDGFDIWDIDLFDNNATMISSLRGNGARVICYFSAGSYENWRPDEQNFDLADLGRSLNGWPGERWLNISSQNVRKVMVARLDLATEKVCDGVDPDNVDGYDNDNGLGLTQADSVNYLEFLADAAHHRNLSIGLKNAGAILPNVIDIMQWSVNEQCVQYDECDVYAPFIQQGKPVFHVEYPKGDSISNNDGASKQDVETICNNEQSLGFSTIMKNIVLDDWTESCPS